MPPKFGVTRFAFQPYECLNQIVFSGKIFDYAFLSVNNSVCIHQTTLAASNDFTKVDASNAVLGTIFVLLFIKNTN